MIVPREQSKAPNRYDTTLLKNTHLKHTRRAVAKAAAFLVCFAFPGEAAASPGNAVLPLCQA